MSFDSFNNALDLGDNYKGNYFLGTVTDNLDPENLDRIKAKVMGLYETDSPWIAPDKHSSFGAGATWGQHGTPAIGSIVKVELENGDPHYPRYCTPKTKGDSDFQSGAAWGFKDDYGNVLRVVNGQVNFQTLDGVAIIIKSGKVFVTAPQVTLNAETRIEGGLTVNGSVNVATGATGCFQSQGNVITVKNGIVTNIY